MPSRLRFTRFVTVGSAAALLLFLLTFAFEKAGAAPFAAGVAAYAIAFVFAYTLQRGWTFGGGHDHRRALPRYLAVQVGCAILSGVVAHAAVAVLGWPAWAASAATTVAASAASFVLSTFWVFPQRGRAACHLTEN